RARVRGDAGGVAPTVVVVITTTRGQGQRRARNRCGQRNQSAWRLHLILLGGGDECLPEQARCGRHGGVGRGGRRRGTPSSRCGSGARCRRGRVARRGGTR